MMGKFFRLRIIPMTSEIPEGSKLRCQKVAINKVLNHRILENVFFMQMSWVNELLADFITTNFPGKMLTCNIELKLVSLLGVWICLKEIPPNPFENQFAIC